MQRPCMHLTPSLRGLSIADMNRLFSAGVATAITGAALLVSGCQTARYDPARRRAPTPPDQPVITPVVGVTSFENRSNFTGRWNLGNGMADILVARLMDSGEVTVLERQHLDSVIGEILRQGRDLFRPEGRVEQGRLKNARFLIRGTVTDFTVVGDTSGWFASSRADARVRGSRARVALYVTVTDVESGEIISSVRTEGRTVQRGVAGRVNYRQMAFGGDAYFRTPLGRATEQAIQRAVRQILRDLPVEYWQARVAEGGPDAIVINGGENVGLNAGDVFAVRAVGRAITDPITGDVIETVPGPVIGRARVTEVKLLSAHARLVEGRAQRGDFLERVP